MIGKSIRVYLPDASVTGIRYAELVNWTGQAIACPRNRLAELASWPEAAKPGVYFLFENRFAEAKSLAYIGESENVLQRITSSHERNKDFWNEAVIFTSKDGNLTKSHIKYLEASLVSLSKAAQRYELDNGNLPPSSSLPRPDRDAMQEFLGNIRMVLGVLGYTILEPILPAHKDAPCNLPADQGQEPNNPWGELQFFSNNISATGYITDEGFVLKKGSAISKNQAASLPKNALKMKQDLLTNGHLHDKQDRWVLKIDLLVSSSSLAASLITGSSRSGPQSWLLKDGRTLKQAEDELLQALTPEENLRSEIPLKIGL